MSICRTTLSSVALCAALAGMARAQDSTLFAEQSTPLTVSGFAVGEALYDRNLAQNTALGSKIGVSFFRPWSDQLYLFAQLTTHLEVADSGPAETAIEIDNLIINWTPAKVS